MVEYLLINYYDPLYKYPDAPSDEYDLSLFASEPQDAIQAIKVFLESQYTS